MKGLRPVDPAGAVFGGADDDQIDLIYEGITTPRGNRRCYPQRTFDQIDLIYEGITTPTAHCGFRSRKFRDQIDLIYEGITTLG